jgi:hypothetical protein
MKTSKLLTRNQLRAFAARWLHARRRVRAA